MPPKRKRPIRKQSLPGDDNWLRTFYRLCGLDSERAEIAIAKQNKTRTFVIRRHGQAAFEESEGEAHFFVGPSSLQLRLFS
jgi:hypothetical protein